MLVYASVIDKTSNTGNLGDMFGYILFESLTKSTKRLAIGDKINDNFSAVVGSILQNIPALVNKYKKKCTVIGAGLITPVAIKKNKNILYLGVRGPLTQKLIESNSNDIPIISDPGLQIDRIFPLPHIPTEKKKDLGFIIHSVDRSHFFNLFPGLKDHLIDNYADYHTFLSQLSQYKKVLSSSLHGIIFCHSYGIPVAPIHITNRIIGGNFKYIDYYHSLGHTQFKCRFAVDKNTNLSELVDRMWQPSRDTINHFKNMQYEILTSYINSN